MQMAEVGDTIKSRKGIIGVVVKVTESSVIIKIIFNPTDTEYENEKTVVNHKNYTVERAMV